MSAGVDAQKRKRKAAKAKVTTETRKEEEKEEKADKVAEPSAASPAPAVPEAGTKSTEVPQVSAPVNQADEMEVYRAIQQRPLATVQDMVDVLLMYRGEFGKLRSPEQRLARARELKLVNSQPGSDKLERGDLAYAIMKTYKPESGWLFWITGFQRYAMRDVQQAEIMPTKAAEGQNLTGEQLLGTITVAEEFVQKRDLHGKK